MLWISEILVTTSDILLFIIWYPRAVLTNKVCNIRGIWCPRWHKNYFWTLRIITNHNKVYFFFWKISIYHLISECLLVSCLLCTFWHKESQVNLLLFLHYLVSKYEHSKYTEFAFKEFPFLCLKKNCARWMFDWEKYF